MSNGQVDNNGNRVTIREVYTLIEEMRKEANADRKELLQQVLIAVNGVSRRVDNLEDEINGREDKPGLRGRMTTLETRTTIAHGLQATMTIAVGTIATWLGIRH